MLHGSAARRYTDLRKIGEFLKCCIYEEDEKRKKKGLCALTCAAYMKTGRLASRPHGLLFF